MSTSVVNLGGQDHHIRERYAANRGNRHSWYGTCDRHESRIGRNIEWGYVYDQQCGPYNQLASAFERRGRCGSIHTDR